MSEHLESYRGRTILVTGGAGAIGSNLTRVLAGLGARTVIVLDEAGGLVGVWVERPAVLQKWYLEQQDLLSNADLLDKKYKWYREDHGKTAIGEMVDLLLTPSAK